MEKRNDLSGPEISADVEKVISDDIEIAICEHSSSLKISPKENYETDIGNDNAANLKLY